jgi:hypothetical protein
MKFKIVASCIVIVVVLFAVIVGGNIRNQRMAEDYQTIEIRQ